MIEFLLLNDNFLWDSLYIFIDLFISTLICILHTNILQLTFGVKHIRLMIFIFIFHGLIIINVLKGFHSNLSGFSFLPIFADGAVDMIFTLLVYRRFNHVSVPVLLRWIKTSQRRRPWFWRWVLFWFLEKRVLIWILLVDVWKKWLLLLLLLSSVLNKLSF
jgi:hypothetical protein